MKVKITTEDLELFRQSTTKWLGIEGGAPVILPVELEKMEDLMINRGEELFQKWLVILFNAEVKCGPYKLEPPVEISERRMREWIGEKPVKMFHLMENHLKLLKSAYWRIDTFGIDGKYPYGNLSYYVREVMEILAEEPLPPDGQKLTPAQENKYRQIHYETLPALQVLLRNFSLQEGKYNAVET